MEQQSKYFIVLGNLLVCCAPYSFACAFMQVSASRVNDRHGWLLQCDQPLQFMSLHIPEENRCSIHTYYPPSHHRLRRLFSRSTCVCRSVDVLELSEQKDLLRFHYHTLRLYSAICALGNNRVAHALCSHVDEAQLLQAIQNKYMPGNTGTGAPAGARASRGKDYSQPQQAVLVQSALQSSALFPLQVYCEQATTTSSSTST